MTDLGKKINEKIESNICSNLLADNVHFSWQNDYLFFRNGISGARKIAVFGNFYSDSLMSKKGK